MSITMSDAKVDMSERETLLKTKVDSSIISGGEKANTTMFGTASGAKLAGVTADFATNVGKAIDSYITTIQEKIEGIEAADSTVAFQGEGIKKALESFITSVKKVAGQYITSLQSAEKQIIDSVAAAYTTQDADLSSNLKTDSATLSADNRNASASNGSSGNH